jgi:hypothetical protein
MKKNEIAQRANETLILVIFTPAFWDLHALSMALESASTKIRINPSEYRTCSFFPPAFHFRKRERPIPGPVMVILFFSKACGFENVKV